MSRVNNPTQVRWNEIEKVGLPPHALCVVPEKSNAPRKFLVRGKFNMDCLYTFEGTNEFNLPGDGSWDFDLVTAWAVIEGF